MAFSRVNNKSRNIRTACASSTLGNLSNNKFLEDYHELLKPYLDDDYGDEILKPSNVDVLLNLAEQEFIQSYGGVPTCAVYAPGCLAIAGKCTNLASSKSLSMVRESLSVTLQGGYAIMFAQKVRNRNHFGHSANIPKPERPEVFAHIGNGAPMILTSDNLSTDELNSEHHWSTVFIANPPLASMITEYALPTIAVQLVTLIVGKRSRDNKWCHVRTLLDEFTKEDIYKFYLNDENLQICLEEPAWIRYLKGTIQCFKAKKVIVPGFEIVIVSSVPIKCGLGSCSALVVAMYTFLEAMTNTQTTSVLEKTLICNLAQRLASESQRHHIADCLVSIIGNEDKIIAFSSRSLTINNYDFPVAIGAEMVLIEFPDFDLEKSTKHRLDAARQKEILIIQNTKSRWRTDPEGASAMEYLFSEETVTLAKDILNEDKRISQMIQAIQMKRWKKLGKLLWENYRHTRKSLDVLPDDMERVMTALQSAEYILGASFTTCGSGASVLVLVQRSRFRSFISLMHSMEIPRQRYYKIKSFTGATTLYTHERHVSPNDAEPRRRYRQTLRAKYYLRDDCMLSDNNYFESAKSSSYFVLAKDSFLSD